MWRGWQADSAAALGLTVVGVVEVLSAHGLIGWLVADPTATVGPLPVDLALALLLTLPVAVRRMRPTAVPAAVFAGQVIANLVVAHHFPFFAGLGALGALAYAFGRHARPAAARFGVLGPVAWAATLPIHTLSAREPVSVVYAGVLLTLPWLVGLVIRRLHDQRAELAAALAQVSELEDERRQAALLAERARIAREMHDVLAHGVSVMVVQAGAARLALAESAPAHAQLLAVEQTGRQVLGELRRTVGLLRSADGAEAAVAPVPGIADLPVLVSSMRAAGVDVELSVRGPVAPDPARELVVYRIVAEALTNSLRHAGGGPARVEIVGGPQVRVSVTSAAREPAGTAPPAAAHPRGGFGLVGLRERVELYRGTFRAVPSSAGFVVEAAIPWEDQR